MGTNIIGGLVRVSRLYTRLTDPVAFLSRRFIRRAGMEVTVTRPVCIDIGAGTAPYRDLISGIFSVERYIAIDIAPTDRTTLVADGCALPLRSESVDLVASFEVIQHVVAPEVFLAEVGRVLAPGGCLLVTFPFLYAECDFRDYQRWTLEGMVALLKRHGLQPLLVVRRGGLFFAAACGLNWVMQHLLPGQRKSWRGRRTWGGVLRSATVALLTVPTNILGWLAIGVDKIVPGKGAYMGGAILAARAGGGGGRHAGGLPPGGGA